MSALLKLDAGESAVQVAALILLATSLAALVALATAQTLKRNPAAAHCVLLWALVWVLSTPLLAGGFVWSGRSIVVVPSFLRGTSGFFGSSVKQISEPEVAIAHSAPKTADPLEQLGENLPPSKLSAVSAARHVKERIDIAAAPAPLPADASSLVNPARGAITVRQGVVATMPTASSLRGAAGVLAGFWLLGAGLLIAGIVRASFSLYWIKRTLIPLRKDSMSPLLADLRRILNVNRLPEICESDRVGVPCVIGIVRPAVVLPYGWGDTLNPQQLRDVLVHECAHVLRRDSFVVLLQRVAAAVCWPNPLVHWLNRRLASVREQVCDNYVLAQSDRVGYGETLWQIARLSRSRRSVLASVGILHRRGQLEERVAGLLDETRNTRTRLSRKAGLAIGGTLGMLCVLACGSPLRSDQPPATRTETAAANVQNQPPREVPPARRHQPPTPRNASKSVKGSLEAVELVRGRPHTLHMPEKVLSDLHIGAVVVQKPSQRTLVWVGTTGLEPNRVVRIRAPFAASQSPADVVQIGRAIESSTTTTASSMTRSGATSTSSSTASITREIRSGDAVTKGTLLAAFYSGDVANKENDLIGAVNRLKIDEQILKVAEDKSKPAPELVQLNARRDVLGDRNAIDRAVSTLKSWGLPDDEIQAVRKEAANLEKRDAKQEKSLDARRGHIDIRSPIDGIILERNLALHEVIVDNNYILFQVGNLDQLLVYANSGDGDIADLDALPPNLRRWTVKPAHGSPHQGVIEEVGSVVDLATGTVPVKGHIDNKDHKLRAGQFVTVTVEVPNPPDLVEVPSTAVLMYGKEAFVFVETDPKKDHYAMRRVHAVRDNGMKVFIRSRPLQSGEAQASDRTASEPPEEPLRPGERVLTAGLPELRARLLELESRARQ